MSHRSTEPSPLLGKLFDEAGIALTPSHAVKSGRRYRYYVSRGLIAGYDHPTDERQRKKWRLPAREIERVVADAVTSLIADRSTFTDALRQVEVPVDDVPYILAVIMRWKGDPMSLVRRVNLMADRISIRIDLSKLLFRHVPLLQHEVSARIKRRGVEMRLVLQSGAKGHAMPKPDPILIKAVVRGYRWFNELADGRACSFMDIAKTEGVSDRYVGQLIPLAFLAPDIVKAILEGTQPAELTAETLIRHASIPTSWTEQRALFRFD